MVSEELIFGKVTNSHWMHNRSTSYSLWRSFVVHQCFLSILPTFNLKSNCGKFDEKNYSYSPCSSRMKQTKQSVIQPSLNWIGPKERNVTNKCVPFFLTTQHTKCFAIKMQKRRNFLFFPEMVVDSTFLVLD